MNLILPTPTVTPGPEYATENNTAFTRIDSHDHTTGNGLQVPSAGIGVDADLSFNQYNATQLRTTRFTNQSAALGDLADIGCSYVAGGNLFYNDSSGVQIQLTAGGALNASSIGGIGGDYGTSSASVFYTSIAETFYFTSNVNTPSDMDTGSVTIHEPAASTNGIKLQSPTALAANYNLILPSALPAATSFVTLSSAGALASNVSTTAGITGSNIAASTITGSNIASATITGSNIAASTVAITNLDNTAREAVYAEGINPGGVGNGVITILIAPNVGSNVLSAYNSSTGVYTVPFTGYLSAAHSIVLLGSGSGAIQGAFFLYKNGSPVVQQITGLPQGVANWGAPLSVLSFAVTAGDLITARFQVNGATSIISAGFLSYTMR